MLSSRAPPSLGAACGFGTVSRVCASYSCTRPETARTRVAARRPYFPYPSPRGPPTTYNGVHLRIDLKLCEKSLESASDGSSGSPGTGEAIQHVCCALEQWNIDLDPPGPKSRSSRSSRGRPLREQPPRRRPPRARGGLHAPPGVSGSRASVRGEGSEQIIRLVTGVEYHTAPPGGGRGVGGCGGKR